MRKILTIIMLTLLLTVSCGKPEAQKILEKDLNALQSGEITNITGLVQIPRSFQIPIVKCLQLLQMPIKN